MYGWWDSIDIEPIPIDLLEGPIGMHLVGIEPANSPILFRNRMDSILYIREEGNQKRKEDEFFFLL